MHIQACFKQIVFNKEIKKKKEVGKKIEKIKNT